MLSNAYTIHVCGLACGLEKALTLKHFQVQDGKKKVILMNSLALVLETAVIPGLFTRELLSGIQISDWKYFPESSNF